MKAKAFGALITTALLAGCASSPLTSFHQQSEKLETTAEALYQSTYAALEALRIMGAIDNTTALNDEITAWRSLMDVRTAYNLGYAINMAPLEAVAHVAGVKTPAISGGQ